MEAKQNNIVFSITEEDLQLEAQYRISRNLTDDEIYIAKKGLESALLFDIDTVYSTIFNEMIKE